MLARDGEEAKEVAGRKDRGADGVGLLGLWDTADGGLLILVLGMNVVVHWQQLASGVTEPLEGAGKMGTSDGDLSKGGIG